MADTHPDITKIKDRLREHLNEEGDYDVSLPDQEEADEVYFSNAQGDFMIKVERL